MSGVAADSAVTNASGNTEVNALLWDRHWSHNNLTFSSPTATAEYAYQVQNFATVLAQQTTAINEILGLYSAVCNLTFAAPAAGTYRVRFRARAYRSTQPIKVEVGAGDVHKGNRGRHIVGYFDVQPEMTEIVFEDWLRAGDGFSVRPFGIGNVRIGQNRNYAGPGLLFADYDVDGPIDEDLAAGKRALLGAVDLRSATAADDRPWSWTCAFIFCIARAVSRLLTASITCCRRGPRARSAAQKSTSSVYMK